MRIGLVLGGSYIKTGQSPKSSLRMCIWVSEKSLLCIYFIYSQSVLEDQFINPNFNKPITGLTLITKQLVDNIQFLFICKGSWFLLKFYCELITFLCLMFLLNSYQWHFNYNCLPYTRNRAIYFLNIFYV